MSIALKEQPVKIGGVYVFNEEVILVLNKYFYEKWGFFDCWVLYLTNGHKCFMSESYIKNNGTQII